MSVEKANFICVDNFAGTANLADILQIIIVYGEKK